MGRLRNILMRCDAWFVDEDQVKKYYCFVKLGKFKLELF